MHTKTCHIIYCTVVGDLPEDIRKWEKGNRFILHVITKGAVSLPASILFSFFPLPSSSSSPLLLLHSFLLEKLYRWFIIHSKQTMQWKRREG